jgi:outer membrane biosynthesis protein TonB
MRVSSCVLLFLLSASLASSITILDVPKSVNSDEVSPMKLLYDDDTDVTIPETENGRRLLVSIKKSAKKVSTPPPPPPEPKKEPKQQPKQQPKKEPKQEPKQEPKKEPKKEPKQEP